VQSIPDFELLVIDNGSIDDTRYVVRRMEDSRIKYILNPCPTNTCDGARNLGIKLAKGTLISFLDDDDIWYPDRMLKVKRAFEENPDVSAVCHYENRRINNRVDGLLKHGPWTENFLEVLLYERNCLSSCGTTIKAGLLRDLGGFVLHEEFYMASDYDLWLRMAAKNIRFYFIEEPLGEFCVTGNNLSHVNPAIPYHVACLIRKHIREFEKKHVFRISTRGLWRLFQLYSIAGRTFLNGRQYKFALMNYFRALSFLLLRPTLSLRLILNLSRKFRLSA
jgi:glycosyltransferase involved in cell wall biosynthesis